MNENISPLSILMYDHSEFQASPFDEGIKQINGSLEYAGQELKIQNAELKIVDILPGSRQQILIHHNFCNYTNVGNITDIDETEHLDISFRNNNSDWQRLIEISIGEARKLVPDIVRRTASDSYKEMSDPLLERGIFQTGENDYVVWIPKIRNNSLQIGAIRCDDESRMLLASAIQLVTEIISFDLYNSAIGILPRNFDGGNNEPDMHLADFGYEISKENLPRGLKEVRYHDIYSHSGYILKKDRLHWTKNS